MKKLLRITALAVIISLLVELNGGINLQNLGSTVRAFGDLTVNFHVPSGDPIFNVQNMAPGQTETRNVDVTNNGTVPRLVAVKGHRTGGSGDLESVLSMVINNGSVDKYGGSAGSKHLTDFFTDSASTNGILLDVLSPTASKTYIFTITFDANAGNEFQNKDVVFDLSFGAIIGNNVVINEVYYQVDSSHGKDSPADRGVTVNGTSVSIHGNGAGSVNKVFINTENNCQITQVNNALINNNVSVNNNTDGNSAGNDTGGNTNVNNGNANGNVNVTNNVNINTAKLGCGNGNGLGLNDEWVELFNPTDHIINLKNWTFTDNSGISVKINGNRNIQPSGFALVSKDNSTWNKWAENPTALKIPLGHQFGDGLNNSGDRLILKDKNGNTVDALSWGADTSIFTIPNALLGSSLERLAPGFDTNSAADWHAQNPPTPGN